MAADDDRARRKPFSDAFIRFLLPPPKPVPAEPSPPECLVPPHRLLALTVPRPRPDERLFIVPPTRPDWLTRSTPPQPPPPPPPPPPPRPFLTPPNERRARNAGRPVAAWNGNEGRWRSRRIPDAFPPNGGRAGPPEVRRKEAPHHEDKKKKAWVAVEKNKKAGVAVEKKKKKKAWVAVGKKKGNKDNGDEDRAEVVSEGYSGGDEGDDDQEITEQEGGGGRRLRLGHLTIGGEVKNSLATASSILDRPDGSDGVVERPVESNQAPPNLRGRGRPRGGQQVECRHDIDEFTPGFIALYESLKPSDELKAKQQQLVDSLAKTVRAEWPDAQLHLYGSCANSFGTSHSDVDVCLQMDQETMGVDESAVDVLVRLAEVLSAGNFESVEAITTARVPIVRMTDPGTGFSCDICVNNLFAVANTKLLKDYARIDQRLLQLAFLVKHWAKLRGVNEAYRGTLSSYAYVIMCINFLQLRQPKILPCLQAMEPTYELNVDGTGCAYFDEIHQLHDFGAENKDSIAKLLWEFFHYWAFHHDYRNAVISVRLGKTITKDEKNWTTRVGNDRHLICIEDPFETGHDLGRVVDRQTIRILRKEFERAAAVLQYDHDPCVTLFEPYTL